MRPLRKYRQIKTAFLREQGSGRVQSEINLMNHQILADIELNRKISLFQKAVEAYTLHRSLKNATALAKAKAELACFVWGG